MKLFFILFLLSSISLCYSQSSANEKEIFKDKLTIITISPAEPTIKDTITMKVFYNNDHFFHYFYTAESRVYKTKKEGSNIKENLLKVSFWHSCSPTGKSNENSFYQIKIPPLPRKGKYEIQFIQSELYSDSKMYETSKHCFEKIDAKVTILVK